MSSNHSTGSLGDGGEHRGLRSALAARCRLALRDVGSDESSEHIAKCSFCTARTKAANRIAKFASQRPEVPAALSAASMLEGIYDRVAESAQQVSLGEWLQQADVPVPDKHAPEVSAEASPWADVTSSVERANGDLIGEFLRGPVLPDVRVWFGVRRSILADVAHESAAPTKLRLMNWRVLLAGAAASAVIALLAVSDPAPVHPTIVFADLDRAPDVEFATVRYGSRH